MLYQVAEQELIPYHLQLSGLDQAYDKFYSLTILYSSSKIYSLVIYMNTITFIQYA